MNEESSFTLEVSGLSYFKRLSELSFSIQKGEILAVLGPNGSGKTTLLKCISGLLFPPCGSIFFRSVDVTSYSPKRWAEKIQYVSPSLKVEFPITVSQVLSFGDPRLDQSFEILKATNCDLLKDHYLRELSSGELSRVAFAQALLKRPQLLLLDETFSFMDLDHQFRMGSLLKTLAAQGLSILLVTHDYNFATEWATQVLFLKEGKKIAFGPLDETVNLQTLSHLYPSSRIAVFPGPSGKPKIHVQD